MQNRRRRRIHLVLASRNSRRFSRDAEEEIIFLLVLLQSVNNMATTVLANAQFVMELFPELQKEMEDVVGWFNENARKLLELHLASSFKKCLTWFRGNHSKTSHLGLIQEGRDLVNYALINAVAIRKILKKYDKIHESSQGQAFKTQVQKMRIEILQSPWLCELMAFHINLKESQKESGAVLASLFGGCSFIFDDGKPFLSCELSDSVKVDIDLTCSICLDTVFDPISLTCGHIYCYMCACSAASVNVVDGLKAADPSEKCPLCREVCVYKGAVHLDELSILLKRSCRVLGRKA
ncbi:hypothetical protein Bca52824_096895 [Brassica carinata]|uniref:RING-type E3 ubiquitin transferase n=1 Tax=Brassica carinata TaxID=52824 RepID=A0A8X7NYJ2_BRACI|nr:hypothetical protein Bca52824_096895 [Brassica carinata]